MPLLNNLRLLHKILIICFVLLVPTGYLLYQLVNANNVQTDSTKMEKRGADLLNVATRVLFEGVKGRADDVHKGKDAYGQFDAALAEFNKEAGNSDLVNKETLKAINGAKGIEDRLDRVVDQIGEIDDKSNLTLDPDLDTFYTMDAATVKMPALVREMSDVHRILADAIQIGSLSASNKKDLAINQVLIGNNADGLRTDGEKSFAGNTDGTLKVAMAPFYKDYADKMATLLELLSKAMNDNSFKSMAAADVDKAFLEFEKTSEAFWEKGFKELQRMLAKRIDGFIANETQGITITGAMFLFALFIMIAATRSIVKPLSELLRVMGRLAHGELDLNVPSQERKEEVGDVARAVVAIREGAAARAKDEATRAEAARVAQEEEKRRAEEARQAEQEAMEARAAAERRKAMKDLANNFENSVGGVVEAVSSAATELRSSAESLTHISSQTTDRATAVAAATEEATASVQTVAQASEQLLGSISEISRKMDESASFTRQAVDRAQKTNTTMCGLAEAAKRIDNVVKLIQDIAWQTNLLALNATIEAARAGDAGKGFAVVASEVKNLADQTSKATVEISEQIGAMQNNTNEAVTAIQDIGKQIEQINQISQSIAAAVEEQSAATKEIAYNVKQASVGTQEVSLNILEVSKVANEGEEAASQVLGAASELSTKSEQLRQLVDGFIAQVRE